MTAAADFFTPAPRTTAPTWEECLAVLEKIHRVDVLRRWLCPPQTAATVHQTLMYWVLTLEHDTQFIADEIQKRYADQINLAWNRVTNSYGQVEYGVKAQPVEMLPAPEPEKLPAKVIQFPLWPDSQRGVPNDFLRSALFAGIEGKTRQHMKRQEIAAYGDVCLKYTGEQLDQSDLDVWEQVVHLVREHPAGTLCHFKTYSFLKAIGRSRGSSDYKWLHGVLLRLQTCAVEVYKGNDIFSRSLVTGFDILNARDEIKVMVDSDILRVYAGGWAAIDWDIRERLRRKPLALWLHGFYSTHADPYPISVTKLHELSGSKTKQLKHFRANLKTALQDLVNAKVIEAWEIDKHDLVHVVRGAAISPSQARHLIRKTGLPVAAAVKMDC